MALTLHLKMIKNKINRQIRKFHPDWKSMTKKEKKTVSKQIGTEVVENYDFNKEISDPVEELLAIEDQSFSDHVITLDEMKQMVREYRENAPTFIKKSRKFKMNIKNQKLLFIDKLLDDHLINRLLGNASYTPSMREIHPVHLFRAELLKAIKYPEITYRKFCTLEYFGLDRKENRQFIGLPLHKKVVIDHTQLSKFRSSLEFYQVVNILVYIIFHVTDSGLLENYLIHGVDSTDLANDCSRPLFSMKVKGKKIKVYKDLDCDCGKRRGKRDKSDYFIGYRMHTLTAIDPKTGKNLPLLSLLTAANHHDSLVLKPLIKLAHALGIKMELITADEAYHDEDDSIFNETGTRTITPASANVTLPDNVEVNNTKPSPPVVKCNDNCETPMEYLVCFEEGHEYKCGATHCISKDDCSQSRTIQLDKGYFQRVIVGNENTEKAIGIRKHSERAFNVLKHNEGLEQVRVRSQKSLIAKCAFGTIVRLLTELEKERNEIKQNNGQMSIFDWAA